MVLCGGRGVRLKPLTDDIPKALAPCHGRPMLDHILDFFSGSDFDRFSICVGYKGNRIREHLRNWRGPTDLIYSDIGEEAGMLPRLYALRETGRQQFLVIYGDTFINLDTDRLLNHHAESKAAATIVTAEIRNPFGVVTTNAGSFVESFEEKPLQCHYIGCMVLEQSAFEFVTPNMLELPDGEGLVTLFDKLISERRLASFLHKGLQISFNTESERQHAETELGRYYTYPEQL